MNNKTKAETTSKSPTAKTGKKAKTAQPSQKPAAVEEFKESKFKIVSPKNKKLTKSVSQTTVPYKTGNPEPTKQKLNASNLISQYAAQKAHIMNSSTVETTSARIKISESEVQISKTKKSVPKQPLSLNKPEFK